MAPIALFVYARPDHTRITIDALLQNPESVDSDLIIFSDAANTSDKAEAVEKVRDYCVGVQGFKSVTVHRRQTNFGLAKSIIAGVTQVLSEYESIIVLEDDLVTSPYFLGYMNESLLKYANDDRVISIHGYLYPGTDSISKPFFLRGADCWGWATWRRGWSLFNMNGQLLLDELRRKKLVSTFDFNGSYNFSGMLKGQIAGRVDSWAVRWYASAFLANKLTLYPDKSLVQNIGNDSTGTHCGSSNVMDVALAKFPIDLSGIQVKHSEYAFKTIESFFRRNQTKLSSILHRARLNNRRFKMATLAKEILPPWLLRQLLKLYRRSSIRFEGPFVTWEEAANKSTGYCGQQILDKVLAATIMVKNGEAAYERDSVVFDEVQHSWPIISGLMWAGARCDGRLSVLDFGGALGSSYFQNRQFFEGMLDISWSVVEQLHFVQAGRKYIQNDHLRFYETIDACVKAEMPNVVLLSSVLQYLEKPYEILKKLLESDASLIIIDRTPYWVKCSDALTIQHVPPQIYPASYPMHIFSEKHLLERIGCEWSSMAEFLSPEGYVESPVGKFAFKGFLLQRKDR